MKIIVLHNQSLLDVALQNTGTTESAFELALANGLSITDDVKAGQSLILSEGEGAVCPSGVRGNNDILNYYTAKNIQPATGFTVEDKQIIDKLEGISIWAINMDFVVAP